MTIILRTAKVAFAAPELSREKSPGRFRRSTKRRSFALTRVNSTVPIPHEPSVESAEQLSSERSRSATASRPLRIVVLGMMGRMPLAGVVWQVLHYLEGFRRLGFDVYYVEDTGAWPFDPEQNTISDDCSFTVRHI